MPILRRLRSVRIIVDMIGRCQWQRRGQSWRKIVMLPVEQWMLIVEVPDLVTSVVLGIWRRGGRIYSLRTCIFLSVHLHSPQNHDFRFLFSVSGDKFGFVGIG